MKQRIISAVILAPIFVILSLMGGNHFLAMIMVICGISAWEFAHIFDQDKDLRVPLGFSVVTTEVLLLTRAFIGIEASHRILTACIMAALIWGIWACEKQIPRSAISFAVLTACMVYIGWLGGYMISIRTLDAGKTKFLLTAVMVWTADIWAYFTGIAFGKHKISKIVSPKKSWEGYIGGIICTVICAILAERFIPAVDAILNMKQSIVLALAISIVSPIGDLGESMIKRTFGVKDSSNLIPGHGGFFDRFDAMFFAMPIAYYIFEWINLGGL